MNDMEGRIEGDYGDSVLSSVASENFATRMKSDVHVWTSLDSSS